MCGRILSAAVPPGAAARIAGETGEAGREETGREEALPIVLLHGVISCAALPPLIAGHTFFRMADFPFQYAVKFICISNIPGTSQTTTSFLPGAYQTAVNIHNPNEEDVRFRMKLASPIEISEFLIDGLKPDGAGHVDCSSIPKFCVHPIHGFEGFLVIESTKSLDVVAVYTAGAVGGPVASIDVEYVRERVLG